MFKKIRRLSSGSIPLKTSIIANIVNISFGESYPVRYGEQFAVTLSRDRRSVSTKAKNYHQGNSLSFNETLSLPITFYKNSSGKIQEKSGQLALVKISSSGQSEVGFVYLDFDKLLESGTSGIVQYDFKRGDVNIGVTIIADISTSESVEGTNEEAAASLDEPQNDEKEAAILPEEVDNEAHETIKSDNSVHPNSDEPTLTTASEDQSDVQRGEIIAEQVVDSSMKPTSFLEVNQLLESQLRAQKEESERMREELEKNQLVIGLLKSELQQVQGKDVQIVTHDVELESEIASLRSELAGANEEIDRLKQERDKLMDKQSELSGALYNKDRALFEAQSELQVADEKLSEVSAAAVSRHAELEKEIIVLKQSLEARQEVLQSTTAQLEDLTAQLQEVNGKLNHSLLEIARFSEENRTLNDKMDELRSLLSSVTLEKESAAEDLSKLAEKHNLETNALVQTLKGQLTSLQSENAQCRAQVQEAAEALDREREDAVLGLEQQRQRFEEERNASDEDKQQLLDELLRQTEKVEELKISVENMKQELERHSEKVEDVKRTAVDDTENLSSSVTSLSEQLLLTQASARKVAEELRMELDMLKISSAQERRELLLENEDLRFKIMSDATAGDKEIESLKIQISELTSQLESMTNSEDAENLRLSQEVALLKLQLDNLRWKSNLASTQEKFDPQAELKLGHADNAEDPDEPPQTLFCSLFSF